MSSYARNTYLYKCTQTVRDRQTDGLTVGRAYRQTERSTDRHPHAQGYAHDQFLISQKTCMHVCVLIQFFRMFLSPPEIRAHIIVIHRRFFSTGY